MGCHCLLRKMSPAFSFLPDHPSHPSAVINFLPMIQFLGGYPCPLKGPLLPVSLPRLPASFWNCGPEGDTAMSARQRHLDLTKRALANRFLPEIRIKMRTEEFIAFPSMSTNKIECLTINKYKKNNCHF